MVGINPVQLELPLSLPTSLSLFNAPSSSLSNSLPPLVPTFSSLPVCLSLLSLLSLLNTQKELRSFHRSLVPCWSSMQLKPSFFAAEKEKAGCKHWSHDIMGPPPSPSILLSAVYFALVRDKHQIALSSDLDHYYDHSVDWLMYRGSNSGMTACSLCVSFHN